MSHQWSLLDLLSVTSSPGSGFGLTPSVEPVGTTVAKCGLDPALANRSARQAKALGLLTSGTYGQRSSISSSSAVLTSCLANRLRLKTALLGSTLFNLTWKERDTPSGRSIPALRASVRRTSGSDCTGWPTPTVCDDNASRRSSEAMERAINRPNACSNLAQSATLARWPTPQSSDMTGGGQAERAMGETQHGSNLNDFAMLAHWPTTTAPRTTGRPMHRSTHLQTQVVALLTDADQTLAGWQSPTATNIGERNEAATEKRRLFRESIGRQSIAPGNLEEQVMLYLPSPARRTP